MAENGECPTIDIDVGMTYSYVGIWQHDRVEIIANDQGNWTAPSYVVFTDTERLIGSEFCVDLYHPHKRTGMERADSKAGVLDVGERVQLVGDYSVPRMEVPSGYVPYLMRHYHDLVGLRERRVVLPQSRLAEITMSAVWEWAASQDTKVLEAVAVNKLGKWKTATQMTALTILLASRDSSSTLYFCCSCNMVLGCVHEENMENLAEIIVSAYELMGAEVCRTFYVFFQQFIDKVTNVASCSWAKGYSLHVYHSSFSRIWQEYPHDCVM
ncbi:hypothetical protein Taro_033456 [Colocasia esculenta]|uniref:Uncharacterized protein n=1 Tax=Colocasia esculenta TaxID=4460 RepID=A0A843VXY4_COLES|nr:hypothetical protein [Colocasia esculenta]